MRKSLFALTGLLIVMVAAVFIVPGLIDWNSYKGEITAQVERITGRIVSIEGRIKFTILPAPALIIEDVSIANDAGASTKNLISLHSLQIRVALLPLFAGQVQVESVRLIEPVIELEILADGRGNWAVEASSQSTGKSSGKSAPTADTGGGSGGGLSFAPRSGGVIKIDSFIIRDGVIIYRDRQSGIVETIVGINAEIAAASLQGPFESTGAFIARGIPVNYDVSTGLLTGDGGVSVGVKLGIDAVKATVQARGTVFGIEGTPRFNGELIVQGEHLARLIRLVLGTGSLPGYLSQSFAINGKVSASAELIETKNSILRLGSTQASLAAWLKPGKEPAAEIRIGVGNVNLDALLALAGGDDGVDLPASSDTYRGSADQGRTRASVVMAPLEDKGDGAWDIPTGVTIATAMSIEALTFRGGIVRKVMIAGELNDGEVTINQLTAQMPGGSRLAVFGFVAAKDGHPRFEGEIEGTTSNFRGVMRWLDLPQLPIPADRLRRVSVKAKVVASKEQLQFIAVDVRFDSSRLTGGVTVALRDRIAFGASLSLDRINLDAYMPAGAPEKSKSTNSGTSKSAATLATSPTKAASTPPESLVSFLDQFDANLKAKVDAVTWQGVRGRNVALDVTLYNGELKINQAGADNLAGAKVSFQGEVKGLSGTPVIKGGKFDFSAKDTDPLFRIVAVAPPFDARVLGAVRAKGTIEGSLSAPVFDVTINAAGLDATASGALSGLVGGVQSWPMASADGLKFDIRSTNLSRFFKVLEMAPPLNLKRLGAVHLWGEADGTLGNLAYNVAMTGAGATLSAQGKLSSAPVIGGFDAKVSVSHKDIRSLLRVLGSDYRLSTKGVGISIAARLRGDQSLITLESIKGNLGAARVGGTITVALAAPRPKITANLTTGEILIDDYLPVRQARIDTIGPEPYQKARMIPANWILPSGAVSGAAPAWQSMIVQAAVRRGSGVPWTRDPIDLAVLGEVDLDIKLKSDALGFEQYRLSNADVIVEVVNGVVTVRRIAGGFFGGSIFIGGEVRIRPGGIEAESAVDLKNVDIRPLLLAMTGKGDVSGRLSMNTKITGVGRSQVDLIAALDGDGSFRVTNSRVRARLPIPVTVNTGGGFRINNGVVRFNKIDIDTTAGPGQAAGYIDLLRWYMEINGEVHLLPDMLSSLLAATTNVRLDQNMRVFGFGLIGSLDNPQVITRLAPELKNAISGGGLGLAKELIRNDKGRALIESLQGLIAPQQNQPPAEQPRQPYPQSYPQSYPQPDGTLPPPGSQPQQQQRQPTVQELILKEILRRTR